MNYEVWLFVPNKDYELLYKQTGFLDLLFPILVVTFQNLVFKGLLRHKREFCGIKMYNDRAELSPLIY